jgi:Protein of unknown function (DUF2795)
MERGNTKHGPAHDQQMAREAEGMVRGAGQSPHGEKWRETEPVEDAIPPPRRGPQDVAVEERSELARVMSRDVFPADREALLRRLVDSDAPQGLTDRVARLPVDRTFSGVHDVLTALGINSPEASRDHR